MINYLVFDNEITLYWDKEWDLSENLSYKILLDEKEIANAQKTHCSIFDLAELTVYNVKIIRVTETKEEIIFDNSIRTFAKKQKIDITKPPYNAVGDGVTLNTFALQKAIDDCGVDECVYVPEGTFLTGALNLHSNMEIYVEKNAVLQGSADLKDYTPKIRSRFEGTEMMCYRSLLNMGELDKDGSYTCKNVIIRGGGTIYGGGRKLAENIIEFEKDSLKDFLKQNADYVATCEKTDTIPARSRGRLINISNCENVVIGNLKLGFSPAWNVHMIYSSGITTYGCYFHSEKIWNGDGWNPDSSEHCTIFGCEFFTGDDAVAIKSGKNPEGNIINRPCEHIRVFDCVSHLSHGITIGSEMSGGVNDVKIWNCDLRRSKFGIQIKSTKKRGGFVRNFLATNCNVSRVLMHSVPYNDDGIPAPTAPIFEDCYFENLSVTGEFIDDNCNVFNCNPIEISGFDKDGFFIKNVKLKNIVVDKGSKGSKDGVVLGKCEGVTFENIYSK